MRASEPKRGRRHIRPAFRWALDVAPICRRCGRSAHEPLARAARVQAARARRPRGPCVPLFGGDFCCRPPPPAAGTACSRHSCAPQVWIFRRALFLLRRCSFTMDQARLLYRCVPARLPLRSAPAKVGFSHRASSCARGGFDFIFGRLGGRLHPAQMELVGVWAVGAAGGGCGGAVGGHRQPIPRRAREICVQNRPRRRAASPRGASGVLELRGVA